MLRIIILSDINKYFRVDKMLKLKLLEDKREGKEIFDKTDMVSYSQKRFGMFDGKEETVTLECENRLAGVFIDQFGKNVKMRKMDEDHFTVNVDVAVSGQFLGWVIALGKGVKIVAPESVVQRMREEAERLALQYTQQ